jgi:hypothetical protein
LRTGLRLSPLQVLPQLGGKTFLAGQWRALGAAHRPYLPGARAKLKPALDIAPLPDNRARLPRPAICQAATALL